MFNLYTLFYNHASVYGETCFWTSVCHVMKVEVVLLQFGQ